MPASHPIDNSEHNELETVDRRSGTDNAIRHERDRGELFDFTFCAPKSVAIAAIFFRSTGTFSW